MRKPSDALDLLASLGAETRRVLMRSTTKVSLPAGEVLFREGEAGDALYVVLSGSLGVYVRGTTEEDRLVNLVGAGESVGEMALISGEPRSATLVAIRDTELLSMSKPHFDRLLKTEPEIMSGLMRILVHRLRQQSAGTRTVIEPRMVAFLPAQREDDCEEVAHMLARELEGRGRSVRFVGREDMARGSTWFGKLEAQCDLVFLVGTLASSEWVRMCARQADRIIVVADACRPPGTALPAEMLEQRAEHQLLDLVLVHPSETARPVGTDEWTAAVQPNRHFHVRRGDAAGWARLGRVISGEALGLVLSGGGARAFAHLGVVRAFEEHGLAIDFIGGTSMGALVGAGLAMDRSIADLTGDLREAFVHGKPLNDVTLPVLGLVRGRKVERLLERHFGDRRIGDLWRPFYCVSSNLTLGSMHVHRRGRVADALRASVALPGILPPVLHEQGVLVDGAAINNLPVDVMRLMHRGPVAAVDVAQDRAVGPETLRALTWHAGLKRLPIVSVLMRAATISSGEQDRRNASAADLLLAPPLGEIEIRDWRAFDRAVETGYAYAVKALAEHGGRLMRRRER